MGLFNVLTPDVTCPGCDTPTEVRLQFKFGQTWQHEYRIGDRLRWGRPLEGQPGLSEVAVDAVAELAPPCCQLEDFVVLVERDVITAALPFTGQVDFSRDTWVVIEE